MIIKINGSVIEEKPLEIINLEQFLPKNKKEMKKLKKLSTWLWSVSGSLFANSHAFAAGTNTSLWSQMQPLWSIFQDIALTIGGLALFIGIITFMFKRNLGKSIVMTAIIAVGGCFLVPSALMLLAIVGHMLNESLMHVFQNMNVQNSVHVGGGS
jgi:hypothetical protein